MEPGGGSGTELNGKNCTGNCMRAPATRSAGPIPSRIPQLMMLRVAAAPSEKPKNVGVHVLNPVVGLIVPQSRGRSTMESTGQVTGSSVVKCHTGVSSRSPVWSFTAVTVQ